MADNALTTTHTAHRIDILSAVAVGYALGGGEVPAWATLPDGAWAAIHDAEKRDADQVEWIANYLHGFDIEWSSVSDGRVIDVVCRMLEGLIGERTKERRQRELLDSLQRDPLTPAAEIKLRAELEAM